MHKRSDTHYRKLGNETTDDTFTVLDVYHGCVSSAETAFALKELSEKNIKLVESNKLITETYKPGWWQGLSAKCSEVGIRLDKQDGGVELPDVLETALALLMKCYDELISHSSIDGYVDLLDAIEKLKDPIAFKKERE